MPYQELHRKKNTSRYNTKPCSLPFPERQIIDSSKLKKFADNDFKFDENGRKFFKRLENTVGKEENAPYKQFLLIQQC